MTKAFALLDMVNVAPDGRGKVISTHSSMAAAKRADRRVQAVTALAGVRNFPTKIVPASAIKQA